MLGEHIQHGTALGYRQGCRSRGGCANHGSATYMTCVDAALARRADFMVSRLSAEESVLRHQGRPVESVVLARQEGMESSTRVPPAPRASARRKGSRGSSIVQHGTSTGYLKGCRNHDACPKGSNGLSCNEARNATRRRRAREVGVASPPEVVDARSAAHRIEELRRVGLSLRTIAGLTLVGRTTIANVAAGSVTTIRQETSARILAARLPPA